MDWKTMLSYISGSVDAELLLRNEYLVAENRVVPSINSICMRLANCLQPGCFGRLHVGRFKSRRRLYSMAEV